jgi:hypothetical protein
MNKAIETKLETIEIQIQAGLRLYESLISECDELKEEVKNRKISVVSEPVKSDEELVFELIKNDLSDIQSNCELGNWKYLIEVTPKDSHSFYKKCLFLAIMKGVNQLIEESHEKNFFISYTNYQERYIPTIVKGSITIPLIYPSFFYFSSKEKTEKAINILSNFFPDKDGKGTNLLDWFYKG